MSNQYYIITYGCQMNKSDSERIAGVLENIGFKQSPSLEKADLVIFNICSIRQSAIDRAYSKIKTQNLKFKSAKQNSKIILTGCILEKDKKEFRRISDSIFKIDDLPKLPELLESLGFRIKKDKKKEIQEVKHYLQLKPKYQSNIISYVPIMTGCNNFCTFCVVPYTRGREISRPIKDILEEIQNLVKNNVKEIWLLGQNVNSYKPNFSELLTKVNDIEGNFWIRFTSSHPKDLTNELIKTIAKSKKVTPYFNLPIQSGSDQILKKMNRPYTVKKYKKFITEARAAFKKYRQGLEQKIAISTDAIVGFPGETEKQFKLTKKTFKEIGFSFGYISHYSPRPQTVAFKIKDKIPPIEKKRREKELVEIIEKSALKFNKQFLDKKVQVLILKKKNDFYFGKTRHFQTIKIKSKKDILGQFIEARVQKIYPYGLKGKFLKKIG